MSYFENLDMNTLSSVEQEIYRFIVNNPDKIAYMRVRDIAEKSHTSPTSVFRFINKIGFDSFTEFRLSYKQWLSEAHGEDDTENTIEHHLKILSRKNFNQDLAYQIEKMGGILKEAERIIFFGIGSSGSIAEYTARKVTGLGYDAMMINDYTYPINSHFSRTKKNVLVVYSTSGETKEIVELISALENRNNVFCCCITKNRNGAIAKLCDYVIDYTIQDYRRKVFMDLSTQLPALFISELLIDNL